ncbi:UDP-GlcNAc:undecaprenyl-phosphate GlcNAc-1-phosphate transferase [Fontimonas thermophila]|uniref:UDP-GlcNAc:undecaprenyl-phosphate GlcNAc-1-phosphate transferase n=1 Tax=Fontimonas thermophila TaxID=1076937 RepID=A0A1I2IJT8_9GAMM|nr:MraY family glycosyltransferase [Fontimonas thermophila]SFF42514.1 UDP-GlcNAc:undecaprenyl-phosphate GlcNAc-1-phosphate transferase [Fontimonas thermophila]
MPESLSVFLIGLIIAGILAPIVLLLSPRLGLVDHPGGRKRHCAPTPLVGGLLIYAALWALPVTGRMSVQVFALLTLATVTVVVGCLDDRRELNAKLRLLVQAVLGLLMALWAGVVLDNFGDLLGTGPLHLGLWIALPMTVFAVAAAQNAYNMVDGIDGLAGGLAAIPIAFVTGLAWFAGEAPLFELCLAAGAGLCVFLVMNYPLPGRKKALTFLGDNGSTLIGLLIAWIVIAAAQAGLFRPVFALYLLALPLLDGAGVMWRRVSRGVHLFTPGRDHLHHILTDSGLRDRYVTYFLTVLALLIAGFGWLMERAGVPELLMFVLFLVMLMLSVMLPVNAIQIRGLFKARLPGHLSEH